MTVILRMRAPSGDAAREICAASGEWGYSAQAYNNCYLKCDQTDTDTGTTDEGKFIRKDYTKVGMVEYQHEVTKAWDDDDDRDGKRPEEITLNLMRDGKPATDDDGNPVSVTIGPDSEGVTVDEDGVWHYAFEHLPYTDPDGNVYRYSVTEGRVDGYTTTVSSTDTESAVTNKHVPETTRVDGQKLWSGDEGDPSARPASIDVTLLADGEPAASQTVTPDKDGNWSYGFADLPRYRDHGTEIEYTVEEVVTDQAGRSYTNEVTGSAAEGYTITNTYHPYGELFVTKTVEDATAVSEQQEFELTFVFTRDVDGETQPVTASYAYDVLDAEGNVVSSGTVATNGTVAVKGGQTVHVKDVDEYVKYKVTESEEAGFTLTASEGLTGTISPNEASEASLTNTYRATGKFGPKALKTLENRELRRNQFRFLLYQVTDEGETLVSSPRNEKAGETATREDGTLESSTGAVNFSTLRYTEADAGKTFEYVIREYIPATATNEAGQTYGTPGAVGPWKYEGVTYDETEYELEVSVTDNGDGTLEVEGTYKKDGVVVDEPGSDVRFTNNYSAKGDVTFKAWKDLKGRKVEDDRRERGHPDQGLRRQRRGDLRHDRVRRDADRQDLPLLRARGPGQRRHRHLRPQHLRLHRHRPRRRRRPPERQLRALRREGDPGPARPGLHLPLRARRRDRERAGRVHQHAQARRPHRHQDRDRRRGRRPQPGVQVQGRALGRRRDRRDRHRLHAEPGRPRRDHHLLGGLRRGRHELRDLRHSRHRHQRDDRHDPRRAQPHGRR